MQEGSGQLACWHLVSKSLWSHCSAIQRLPSMRTPKKKKKKREKKRISVILLLQFQSNSSYFRIWKLKKLWMRQCLNPAEVQAFLDGNDIFVSLPTPYGRFIIHGILPIPCDKIRCRFTPVKCHCNTLPILQELQAVWYCVFLH